MYTLTHTTIFIYAICIHNHVQYVCTIMITSCVYPHPHNYIYIYIYAICMHNHVQYVCTAMVPLCVCPHPHNYIYICNMYAQPCTICMHNYDNIVCISSSTQLYIHIYIHIKYAQPSMYTQTRRNGQIGRAPVSRFGRSGIRTSWFQTWSSQTK